jgi:hypothetical protein
MADDEFYWTIKVLWGQQIYRDAPEHIAAYLSDHYVTYDAAYHAAKIVTQWARLPLVRARISIHIPGFEALKAPRRKRSKPPSD